jgi:hypothetical protein
MDLGPQWFNLYENAYSGFQSVVNTAVVFISTKTLNGKYVHVKMDLGPHWSNLYEYAQLKVFRRGEHGRNARIKHF